MEVQVQNTLNKNLIKDYKISVPNKIIDEKVNSRIADIKKNYATKGFRKGHVPEEVIKQKYGYSIRAEESDKILSEQIRKIIKDNSLKVAIAPKVDVKTFEEEKDLECTVSIELFPEVPQIDFAKGKLVKREVEVTAEDINSALNKLVRMYAKWNKQDDSYKAKLGDAVNIDYLGRVDKVEFAGGSAKGYQLELGSKSFIDDFEEKLVGKKAGEEVKVKVKFPKNYHSEDLSGKAAEFEVKINEVLTIDLPEITDEFIKNNFGIENKEKLEEILKQQVEGNYQNIGNELFKKELFDFLNKKYDFDLPKGLVETQLNNIWAQTEEELKHNPSKFKNDKEKEKAKNEKREEAEKLVRVGIILSDFANKNKIEVTSDDINKELSKVFARYPGQEKAIIEYYQKNPQAVEQIRGVVLEEKTINHIMNQNFTEVKKLSTKEFEKIQAKVMES